MLGNHTFTVISWHLATVCQQSYKQQIYFLHKKYINKKYEK